MSAQRTVLVVDDEDAMRDLLQTILKDAGFRVIEAANAEEFAVRALTDKPDAIILDIVLGKDDGVRVYNKLLECGLKRSVPVIFLSGLVNGTKQTCPQDGEHRYALVGKPFDVDKLVRHVRMSTDQRAA